MDSKEIMKKAMEYGVEALPTREVVKLVLNCDDDKAFRISEELLKYNFKLKSPMMLDNGSENEKMKIVGALELGKRLLVKEAEETVSVTEPEDLAMLLMPVLRYYSHEKFYLVALNSKNKVMFRKQIAEGSLNSSVVHPREVYAPAILAHAAAIAVGHNHPSGDAAPSPEDKRLTESLKEAGSILGIPLLDHVIIGDGTYFSFREHGFL